MTYVNDVIYVISEYVGTTHASYLCHAGILFWKCVNINVFLFLYVRTSQTQTRVLIRCVRTEVRVSTLEEPSGVVVSMDTLVPPVKQVRNFNKCVRHLYIIIAIILHPFHLIDSYI